MPEPFRVLQIGFGTLGQNIAKAIIERKNLQLIGVVDINPELQNLLVEDLLKLKVDTQTPIRDNLEAVLDHFKNQPPDVALVATSSSLEKCAPTITTCLAAGIDVLSLCEELSYPYIRHPELSKELHEYGVKTSKTILGTGINPGYLMDLLPIFLTAPVQRVDRIQVTRNMNSSSRRAAFQKKIGTGMTVDDFKAAIASGTITGHVGLVESIHMIGDALDLKLDHVEELPPQPVIATQEIVTPFTTVRKGMVRGLKSRAIGQKAGETLITLDFNAYADASPAYDEVRIDGYPDIHQRIEGGVHGDYATIGMLLNLIPLISEIKPGLLTMKDIPCPHNTERIWKPSA
ncbi:MAG: Gfo/Idh/MocA family oxidoreductase [Promethearchaeota archaeon]